MAKQNINVQAIIDDNDDFTLPTIELLAKRAAFICSNPDCRVLTISASLVDPLGKVFIGVAAHITASRKGAARYDPNLSHELRKDISNGIFLCGSCSIMIDKNHGADYSGALLKEWKLKHEKWVFDWLNKKTNPFINLNMSAEVKAKIEHDIKIFTSLNQIFPEDDFRTFIHILQADNLYYSDSMSRISDYYYQIQKPEFQFHDEDLKSRMLILTEYLSRMFDFITLSFTIYPNKEIDGQYQYRLFPLNNTDVASDDYGIKNQEFFEGKVNELIVLTNGARHHYEMFRGAINEKLLI